MRIKVARLISSFFKILSLSLKQNKIVHECLSDVLQNGLGFPCHIKKIAYSIKVFMISDKKCRPSFGLVLNVFA